MIKYVSIILISFSLLYSNDSNYSIPKMKVIPAGTFMMGDANASRDARHEHKVTLNSFKIAEQLFPPSYVDTEGISLRFEEGVSNYSYYEAIVICNDLSKKEGLDTVYSYNYNKLDIKDGKVNYTGSNRDSSRQDLEGIKIDISKNGYRMPTEAEWEYACKNAHISYRKSGRKTYLELCNDFYDKKFYEKSPEKNPICDNAPKTNFFNQVTLIVTRGKSTTKRSAMYRDYIPLTYQKERLGLRLVQTIVADKTTEKQAN